MSVTIQSIATIVHRQINPHPGTRPVNLLGEYIARAKTIYAARMVNQASEQMREDGSWEVPSQLIVPGVITVKNNAADISRLKIMRSLRNDMWVRQLGEGNGCEFVRYSDSQTRTITDRELMGNLIPFTVVGNMILFITGYRDGELAIRFVSDGTDLKNGIQLDAVIADFVMDKLYQLYSKKEKEDKTNDNNSGQ